MELALLFMVKVFLPILALSLWASQLAAQGESERVRMLPVPENTQPAPRVHSAGQVSAETPQIVFVGGLGDTERNYEAISALYNERGYRTHIYIPGSEDPQFDNQFQSASEAFAGFLEGIQVEGQELHLVGHSMAYAVVMNTILSADDFRREAFSSVTFVNPMLSLYPLYQHNLAYVSERDLAPSARSGEELRLRLDFPLVEGRARLEIPRSVEFVRAYDRFAEAVTTRFSEALRLPPVQVLVSRDDPNIELERIQDIFQSRADLVQVNSDRHNLLATPNRVPELAANLPGRDRAQQLQELNSYRSFVRFCLHWEI